MGELNFASAAAAAAAAAAATADGSGDRSGELVSSSSQPPDAFVSLIVSLRTRRLLFAGGAHNKDDVWRSMGAIHNHLQPVISSARRRLDDNR